jgi:raffinose/stachyose/melibiose transport system permease protein
VASGRPRSNGDNFDHHVNGTHFPSSRTAWRIGGTQTLCYVTLSTLAIIVIYPFITLILGSLKSEGEFFANPVGFPKSLEWHNYADAWQQAHIAQFTINSAIVAAGTVILTLFCAGTASFALSRFAFPGNRIIYLSFVILLTLPVQVYIIPLYVIVVKAKLADNLLGLILCYTTGSLPLSVFLFKTYFDAIPGELMDSARLDGCSDWLTFTRVVLPLSRPIVATVSIFTFVQAWNEFFLALIFIHSPDRQTLPLGLQAFFVNQFQTQFPELFATLTISIAPIVIVYLLLQRQFIAGLTAGAVKG